MYFVIIHAGDKINASYVFAINLGHHCESLDISSNYFCAININNCEVKESTIINIPDAFFSFCLFIFGVCDIYHSLRCKCRIFAKSLCSTYFGVTVFSILCFPHDLSIQKRELAKIYSHSKYYCCYLWHI
jgi:hypothetical protein